MRMSYRKLPLSCSKDVAGSPYAWMSAERALTFFVCINVQGLKSVNVCFSAVCFPWPLKRGGVCKMGDAVQGCKVDCIVLCSQSLCIMGFFLLKRERKRTHKIILGTQ